MSSLNESIAAIFSKHESLCLWWSGGSDSTLLLMAMLEQKKPFGILRQTDNWTKEQKQFTDAIILKYNLQVFAYPPVSYQLIGKDDQISLVSRYAIDALQFIPNVRDLVSGERCGVDLPLKLTHHHFAPIEFATHIFGTRFDDRHYSLETVLKEAEQKSHGKTFLYPLAEWTRAEVRAELKKYDLEIPVSEVLDTGNLVCCHACLQTREKVYCPKIGKPIDGIDWDKEGNLKIFQQIYG